MELKEKRKAACAQTHSSTKQGSGQTSVQELDFTKRDAQVQEDETALARARVESAARRKTIRSEGDASAAAQADLNKPMDDASPAALGR